MFRHIYAFSRGNEEGREAVLVLLLQCLHLQSKWYLKFCLDQRDFSTNDAESMRHCTVADTYPNINTRSHPM